MLNHRRSWIVAIMILAGLCVGANASTYDCVDDLPAPDIVITDRSGDAEYWFSPQDAPSGWYDLRQIHGFITERGIAFAVFCNGSVPSDEVLLVLVDVDGGGGNVGRGEPTADRFARAGYDYAIGTYFVGSSISRGVFRISPTWPWSRNPDIGSWREGRVAYFEVRWDQIGGRPESMTVCAYADNYDIMASDVAPDHGRATLEIPVVANATSLPPSVASAASAPTQWVDSFDTPRLGDDWWWVRGNPASWMLGNGYLWILGDPGTLYGEQDNATNLLLRDAPAGDFELETYVEFQPQEDFQIAGLLIYGDDSNFLLLGPAHCGFCGGTKMFFDYEEDGQGLSSGQGLEFPQQAYVYLKIARQGSTYTGYYSLNGTAWVEVAQYAGVNVHPRGVGIATTGSVVPGAPAAAFDYVGVVEY